MNKIYIIYNNFYMPNKDCISIGGIQTYIRNLCDVIIEAGMLPCVYQMSEENFVCEYQGIEIHGIKAKYDSFSAQALREIGDNQRVIFATEGLIRKYKGKSMVIQHGIAWDKPSHIGAGKIIKDLIVWKKFFAARKRIANMGKVGHVVCVDYNFINWYRAVNAYQDVDLIAIPNFSEIPLKITKPSGPLNLIFARRLFEYRGSKIFANAVERILEEKCDVTITIAGDGPDEGWLKNKLSKYDNVKFIRYESHESLKIHEDKHIAVIPTIGSEGTSLSLLEAMASGCAVICSNVGGMTNIVLDHYNGLMIDANSEQIYLALKSLIQNESLRVYLAQNARATVSKSFSYEIWKLRWLNVLKKVFS